MSEQRRIRQELRQGLHQFIMGIYQSYLSTHSPDEARASVAEAIKEQLRLFMADDASFGESAKDVINAKLEELNGKLKKAEGYDAQMYISEKIDSLNDALDVLDGR